MMLTFLLTNKRVSNRANQSANLIQHTITKLGIVFLHKGQQGSQIHRLILLLKLIVLQDALVDGTLLNEILDESQVYKEYIQVLEEGL